MAQLGHTDAAFTLRVYAHAMRRDKGDLERLRNLVEGPRLGTIGHQRRFESYKSRPRGPCRERRKARKC
jgi:hypothetical protein